ncbi:glycosyltransferase N-terminal domain-containing protein [uncultured Tenacibaculum sp.]|uniref:3-deoxy-D-manno-octulosonic acid transferase n=1 Tax=uncultured Tenacibaculum sp. TaxID=174713 RepID=UPI0026270CCE|nr:glycosyltransferase N-terminal domain-containing protein [uncultured Tenacibaculum sp.]
MSFFYNILIHIAYFIIQVISLFNKKLEFFVSGRKETFKKLTAISSSDRVFWIHAASLGEFEQARPIIEKLKINYPNHKIVVTFFSPSGYEIRKNYDLADVVCYLPFDTKKNVNRFIKLVHPELAIIVKYEFWPNLLGALNKSNTKTILVSGIFRKDQLFFKPYGQWMRKFLQTFSFFFVQNEISKNLLNSIKLDNVSISGDTRFDRVSEILKQDNTVEPIEIFKNNTYTVIAGSTWKEDEECIVDYINNSPNKEEKFIIAPHNINKNKIEELRNSILEKTILYSERNNVNLKDYKVLIIDNIGLLTKIYSYANAAYVGGGLATGLHNILEPATFGIPVVFGGVKYEKFQEAKDLMALGGAKTILNKAEFSNIFSQLKNNINVRVTMGNINNEYIQSNIGATSKILDFIEKNINS